MSDDKRSAIRLSQYGEQAQIAPSLYMPGSVVAGFYNADGSASVPCVCFAPDEWDALYGAGNRALGREAPTALAMLADRIETEPGAPVDLFGVCHEGHEEDIYWKGYAKGRADAAAMVREAVQADRYVPPLDVLHTEPLCAALYWQGATKDQALAAITSAMQGYRSDAQRCMETRATPMLVKLDHSAEVEALRAKVAELEAALADIDERLQHEAWERSERD